MLLMDPQMMDPQRLRKKKRMQSVRDQHLLLPDLPLEHYRMNMMMGIASVEPQESERFEENDSDFQDAEETVTRETDTGDRAHTETLAPRKSMGDSAVPHCESALQNSGTVVPATLHSGEGLGESTKPQDCVGIAH